MPICQRLTQALLVFTAVAICHPTVARSQDTITEPDLPDVLVETFDGDDTTLMLGGQIDFQSAKPPWAVYVADEKFVMENRQDARSLQFNDVAWVKFPGSDSLESTQDMVISAVVDGEFSGKSGVGILVGSGKSGKYVAFTVDDKGRYHVLQKDGRQLRLVHADRHDAIRVGAPNKLTFQVRGAHVVFFANGTKVVQTLFSKRTSTNSSQGARAGIGLAAFGTGRFEFDEVEIKRAN